MPQSSQSLLRGKTAHDVAEGKKQRKALDEFKYYKSWDDSMSDVMKAVRSLAERTIVLNHGTVLTKGLPEDVLSHPDVVEAYLGKDTFHA